MSNAPSVVLSELDGVPAHYTHRDLPTLRAGSRRPGLDEEASDAT